MTIRTVALRPENEAPRKTWQGPRGTTNFVSNDIAGNSTAVLRLQRLHMLGVSGAPASMLAAHAWGETA